MPRIGTGKSPKKIAAQKAKAEKIFNNSANTRAAEIGVTLPANFYELSKNQSQKSLGASYTGAKYVDLYVSNKTAFLQNAVKTATYDYSYHSYGRSTPDSTREKILKNAITAAAQGGVPIESIKSAVDEGSNSFNSYIGKQDDFLTQVASYAAPIAMAYFLPQVGASLGTALLQAGVVTTTATASAVGTALTSIAIQTAQGASFEDALKNATVNAIISTGAPSVATEINDIVKNPAVSDAIVSAGASALRTVASGGSTEDMQNNILGAIAGSATTSATGSNLAGSTVGGAVTGGVAGALSGAASALGTDAARDTSTTTGTSADPGIQVAGGDDATALNMASISAMPEMLGKAGETASPITAYTEEGVTFYERTITGTTPDGKPYSYIATYDPTAPVGKQVDYVTGSGTTVTATAVRPNFSTTDTTTSGGYTPTITTTPLNVVNTSGTSTTGGTDKAILDLISGTGAVTGASTGATTGATTNTGAVTGATTGTGTGTGLTDTTTTGTTTTTDAGTGSTVVDTGAGVVTTPVTDTTGTGTEATTGLSDTTGTTTTTVGTDTGAGAGTGTGTDKAILDLISTDKTTGTGTATDTGTGTTAVDTGTGTDASTGAITDAATDTTDTATEDTTTKPEDKYKPKLFIYGGTTPSTLSQSLGTGDTYSKSVATTGLTGSRGAGEIESKETGKKRRTVWNEESLRLKDALGL